MQIDRAASAHVTPAASRARRTTGASGFHVAEPDEAEATNSQPPAAAACSATALVAVLGRGSEPADHAPELSDEAAGRQGQALLAALAALQAASLAGPGSSQSQARDTLTAMAQACPSAASPALGALLRAIVQRAQVEIAKTC